MIISLLEYMYKSKKQIVRQKVKVIKDVLFSERIVNVWNSLPRNVDFSTLASFKRFIQTVDFTNFLRCSC